MWSTLLQDHAHRPWPLPTKPWVMTMSWVDLLFAHWEVPIDALVACLPEDLEVDTFEGRAYLGVVPFRMESVGPRGLGALPARLPSPRAFPEINVRTYVRDRSRLADGAPSVGKPGVFFFSLDATSRLAVWFARTFLDLPYRNASIRTSYEQGWFRFESRRQDARGGEGVFAGRYRPDGEAYRASSFSLEEWLTERYCLYTADPSGRLRRGEVHHRVWPLRPAIAEIEVNSVAASAGFELDTRPELVHFADRIDVLAWWPEEV